MVACLLKALDTQFPGYRHHICLSAYESINILGPGNPAAKLQSNRYILTVVPFSITEKMYKNQPSTKYQMIATNLNYITVHKNED